jgi:putative nucleotidyltransferase with HDIG domain
MALIDSKCRVLTASLFGAATLFGRLHLRQEQRRTAELHRALVDTLLNALSAGDLTTERHSRRVADLTDALAASYGISGARHSTLRVAALLHDLGKIDDRFFDILHSSHSLSPESRATIQEHPRQSADILRPLESVHPGIGKIVGAHHECWDGNGYPQGAKGDRIPLEARIISVADVFDALTQPRVYRPAMSPEEALAEIRNGAGSRFDPDVVRRLDEPRVLDRWLEVLAQGQRITIPNRSQRTAVTTRGKGRSTKGSIE